MAARDSPRKKHGNRGRHWRLFLVAALLSVALLAAGLVVAKWRQTPLPEPLSAATPELELPSLDLTGADPAVATAIEAARAAVRQSPRSAAAWGHLGMILGAHTFPTEANRCFAYAEQLDPREPRWPYYQGTELCLNDSEVAIAKLQRAVELVDGSFEAARLRLGELLLRQGRLDEAEAQFRRVLDQHAKNARAHLNLARLARERDDLQVSLEHLNHAMADVHTQKASHVLAAEVHRRLGEETVASQERQRAAKLPRDLDWPDRFVEEVMRLRTGKQVRLAAAAGLISQGKSREAAALLRRMVQDYPDSDWAWLLLGRALLGENDLASAEAPLRTAVKLAPDSMEAHFYLGVALLLEGNPRDAAACFRRATEIKPDFAEGHHNLAHCLLRQGDQAGAIAAFRVALNCKPNYPEAHLDLGELLVQQGQTALALQHLKAAAQLNPANPRTQKLLEQLQKQSPAAK
jgi:tetratricopeptide (TPR) repeat protein